MPFQLIFCLFHILFLFNFCLVSLLNLDFSENIFYLCHYSSISFFPSSKNDLVLIMVFTIQYKKLMKKKKILDHSSTWTSIFDPRRTLEIHRFLVFWLKHLLFIFNSPSISQSIVFLHGERHFYNQRPFFSCHWFNLFCAGLFYFIEIY